MLTSADKEVGGGSKKCSTRLTYFLNAPSERAFSSFCGRYYKLGKDLEGQ